ncbi:Deoxyribose-phosphate aldolase [Streptomyces hirsutus]
MLTPAEAERLFTLMDGLKADGTTLLYVRWSSAADIDGGRFPRLLADPIEVTPQLPLLSAQEKEAAVELAMEAGVAYLKNASSGQIETAGPESVRYLVDRARDGVWVKASGSIKSYRQSLELLRAGASLLGTSAGKAIVTDTGDDHTVSY